MPQRLVFVTDGRYRDRAAADLAANGLADGAVGAALEVRTKRPELIEAMVDGGPGRGSDRARRGRAPQPRGVDRARRASCRSSRPVASSSSCAGARTPASWRAWPRPRRSPTTTLAARRRRCWRERPTEADVRDELEYRMRRNGADGPSYDTIVASGPELAARPHHQTSRRTIVEGDTVIIDVGALVDGYHSDMTRTFVVGEPDARQREIYDLVLAGPARRSRRCRAPASPPRDLDEACRGVFRDAGYDDWFIHGTGHGVGLDIHEEPFAAATSTAVLAEGDVVTVEPGLYRDGFGGVRIEDLVSVTATGCATLTTLPKDSPCLRSPPTT